MSNAFTDARNQVKTAVVAGIPNTFTVVPERATPPMAWVAPGDPYISYEGATFGGEILRFEVVVVASGGVNETQADELDDLIASALDALAADDELFVVDVGQPGRIAIGTGKYLAAAIAVQIQIRRT